jgi:pilus assembly protein FimV
MMPLKSLLTSICTLALAGATLGAAAAELGDIAPRSYIGQPLAVDIDLVALTPEEVAGLQVRLADGNVYRGANVTMNPALASVRMQVERRGARSVLHVTTTRAVDADYVHLYVELGVPGKQDVRLATVWLQKDPNPPAPVVVAPVAPAMPPASAMTPAQAEQITAQARAARLAASGAGPRTTPQTAAGAMTGAAAGTGNAAGAVAGGVAKPAGADAAASSGAASGASMASAQVVGQAANSAAGAASSAPVRDRSKPAPLPSVHESETGVPGEVKAAGQARRIAGVWVGADGKVLKTPPREDAAEVPVGVAQALLPLAPLPLPKGVKRPAPVSCAPSGISAKECVALDNHNAELSSKLLELEGKMKVLQGALGGASPAAISAAAQLAKAAAAHGAATTPATAATAPQAVTKAPAVSAALAASGAAAGAAHGESAAKAASSPAGAASHGASAAASLSAQGGTEMNAAKAAAGAEGSASASAVSASASSSAAASAAASGEAASVPTGPVKQIRVLPKLKYKKEKPPETQTDYTMPLAAGAVGLLALLGAGFLWWRKKKSGRGPLQIWQGFRKKKPATPDATAPAAEPAPAPAAESVAS